MVSAFAMKVDIFKSSCIFVCGAHSSNLFSKPSYYSIRILVCQHFFETFLHQIKLQKLKLPKSLDISLFLVFSHLRFIKIFLKILRKLHKKHSKAQIFEKYIMNGKTKQHNRLSGLKGDLCDKSPFKVNKTIWQNICSNAAMCNG